MTTAILVVVGVITVMGVELIALLAPARTLDGDEVWLNELLLTWSAEVATDTIFELGEVL